MYKITHKLQDRIFLLTLAWCINSLAYSIVYPFIPIYLHNARRLPMSTVGLIFPLMGLGVMLGPLIAGWLVDKFGRRKVLIGGPLLRGAVFVVLAILAFTDAPFWPFALLMFLNAFTGMFFQNAADTYLTDITTAAERPHAYSKIRVGINIGWALGPIIGSFLASTPFSLLFGMTAVLCITGAIFVALVCPETTKNQEDSASDQVSDDFSFKKMCMHHSFMTLIIFSFILYMLVSQLYTTLSVFSTGIIGITKNKLGLVYSVNGLSVVFLQIPFTRICDKMKTSIYLRLTAGTIFYGVGYLAVAFCGNAIQIAGAILIITCGEMLIQPALYAAISHMSPATGIGRYMGVFGLMRGLGFAVGPYFGGLLFDRYSQQPVLLWGSLGIIAAVSLLGFIAVWLMQIQAGHRKSLINMSPEME